MPTSSAYVSVHRRPVKIVASLLQTPSVAVIVVVGIVMPRLWRRRERLQKDAFQLPVKQFLEAERIRLAALMQMESRISRLLVAAIAAVGVCFTPSMTSLRQEGMCWSAILVLIVAVGLYAGRKIRRLEAARAGFAGILRKL